MTGSMYLMDTHPRGRAGNMIDTMVTSEENKVAAAITMFETKGPGENGTSGLLRDGKL